MKHKTNAFLAEYFNKKPVTPSDPSYTPPCPPIGKEVNVCFVAFNLQLLIFLTSYHCKKLKKIYLCVMIKDSIHVIRYSVDCVRKLSYLGSTYACEQCLLVSRKMKLELYHKFLISRNYEEESKYKNYRNLYNKVLKSAN